MSDDFESAESISSLHMATADELAMTFDTHPPDPWHYLVGGVPESIDIANDNEPVEMAFHANVARYVPGFENKIGDDCELVYKFNSESNEPEVVIERTHNVLTREEALMHVDECREAILRELQRWHHHKAWERAPRATAKNLLTSKWVLKWKDVDGKRIIKARHSARVQGPTARGQLRRHLESLGTTLGAHSGSTDEVAAALSRCLRGLSKRFDF